MRPIGDPGSYSRPRVSPDCKRLLFERIENGNNDVWMLDLQRGVTTRVTTDRGVDHGAMWSPDGARILFDAHRDGKNLLLVRSAGGGAEELFAPTTGSVAAMDWSASGDVIFSVHRSELWALRGPARNPVRLPAPELVGGDARFSPDGNWISLQSTEAGAPEVFVQSYPDGRHRVRITNGGARHAQWSPDRRRLYYIDRGTERLSYVPVSFAAGRPEFGAPRTFSPDAVFEYAVCPSGNIIAGSLLQPTQRISVVLNWQKLLK